MAFQQVEVGTMLQQSKKKYLAMSKMHKISLVRKITSHLPLTLTHLGREVDPSHLEEEEVV